MNDTTATMRSATDDHYVTEPLVSEPMLPLADLSAPAFEVPSGACDAHVHVFTPGYSHVARPLYTLPDGRLPHFQALMGRLGIDRFVLVQPSFYGVDNSCLLDALTEAGDAARGVVMTPPEVTTAELERMHRRGVRGMRLDLFARANWARDDLAAYVLAMARLVAPLGWHLQFYAPGPVVRDLVPTFARLKTPHVVDHMGYMLAEDGLTPADFDRLLRLTVDGVTHLKLSGPYRVAKNKGYARRCRRRGGDLRDGARPRHLGIGLAAHSEVVARHGRDPQPPGGLGARSRSAARDPRGHAAGAVRLPCLTWP